MPRWSIHVLVAADNNLSAIVDGQLPQFRTADPKRVRFVAQIDRRRERVKRYVLNSNGHFRSLGGTRNLNGGSRQSLINFLIASRHLRFSRSIAVIFSSHGTGVADLSKGVDGNRPRPTGLRGAFALGVDQTSKDFLDNHELQTGLEYAYRGLAKPEIIGCDACLMANVEVAHQLRNCGTFLIASQDTSPARGWSYRRILKTFSDRTTPLRAVNNIITAYEKMKRHPDPKMATLSAVRLDLMNDLARSLDRLGAALRRLVPKHIALLARAREKARTFANFDSIDLHGYLHGLEKEAESSRIKIADRKEVTAAGRAVRRVLSAAVVATNNNPRSSRAHGLSVYLPNSPVFDAYHDLPLASEAPRWYDFVVAYGANRHQRI